LKSVYNVQSLRCEFHQVCLWYFLMMEWKTKYDSYVFCFLLGFFFLFLTILLSTYLNQMYYHDELIPTFHNLTQLKLICYDYSKEFLIDVLSHCPKLQRFDLDEVCYDGSYSIYLFIPYS
jgi:hypothetical protein